MPTLASRMLKRRWVLNPSNRGDMAEIQEMIRCDECHIWVPRSYESRFYFENPWKWFRLFKGKEQHEFCSWLCVKNFVDRGYSEASIELRQ